MKKRVIFVMLILMSFCKSVYSLESQQVIFASDPWPPFTFGKEGGRAQGGISIELCRAIFSRLDIKFKSELFPWRRALAYLKTGEADLTFPLIKNKERSTYLVFTDVVMNDHSRVWYLADRSEGPIEWETLEDLKPYTVGLVRGYIHDVQFTQAIKDGILQSELCLSYEEGIKKLLYSRMDILLGNESVIFSLIKKHPEWEGKIKFTPKFTSQVSYRFGISKKSFLATLVPEINRVIQEMKTDGTLDQILFQEVGQRSMSTKYVQ